MYWLLFIFKILWCVIFVVFIDLNWKACLFCVVLSYLRISWESVLQDTITYCHTDSSQHWKITIILLLLQTKNAETQRSWITGYPGNKWLSKDFNAGQILQLWKALPPYSFTVHPLGGSRCLYHFLQLWDDKTPYVINDNNHSLNT